jgi:hypothetical protein
MHVKLTGETYIYWADEVFVVHEEIGQQVAEKDSKDPCTEESFDRLLWRQLDELGASESDATDVGEDIVCNDQCGWEEKPYQAFKDVVKHEVGLYDDKVEGDMCPREHCELEFVVAFLEGADKEDESWES